MTELNACLLNIGCLFIPLPRRGQLFRHQSYRWHDISSTPHRHSGTRRVRISEIKFFNINATTNLMVYSLRYRGLWSAANTRDADAFLLVYDITSHESLVALDYFNDLIEMESEERPSDKPPQIKFVAGNKVDLAHDRQVTSTEGLNWARDHGCGYVLVIHCLLEMVIPVLVC